MDKLTYLASPYSHPDPRIMHGRFLAVCAAAARLMSEGQVVFSPIAHSHPLAMAGKLPTDWAFWERYDRVMLERSDKFGILPLPGWNESRGIKAEIKIWGKLFYICEPTEHELALARGEGFAWPLAGEAKK
jgi:hypothetical protein